MPANFDKIEKLAQRDIAQLQHAEKSYGDSWRKRGGVGAFMMLARKFDRIENQSMKNHWDVFGAILEDPSNAGILDDIRDLRCYLYLVEAYASSLEIHPPSAE